jgi:hypothetical protein
VKFSITSAKLTGNPAGAGWAQIHEFLPDDKTKLELRGHLFAVVATVKKQETSGELDNIMAGRELLTRLHEEYFGETQRSAFNALSQAVEKVIDEFSGDWEGVEIAAAALVGDIVYSAVGGGGLAAVYRDGALAKILTSQKGKSVCASGRPREGDIFLLGTKNVFEVLTEGVVKGALAGSGIAEAAESLAPAVHSRADTGNFGLVFIKFDKKTPFEAKIGKRKIKFRPKEGKRWSELINKVSLFVKNRLGERKIYIRSRRDDEELISQKKRTTVSIGVILAALLVVSIGFGIRQKRLKDMKSSYQERFVKAQQDFEEAKRLFSLDPRQARELFIEAENVVAQIKSEGVKDKELEKLGSDLEASRESILSEYRVKPELFLDLSILTDGLAVDEIVASSDKIFVLDKEGKRVVRIEIDTKKTEIVSGPETTGEAHRLAAYSDRVFVLGSDGIYELDEKRKKVIEKEWEGDVLIYAYAGNLYVLEKEKSQVWRYPVTETGFGSRQKWLAPGVEPDLTKIFSWVIDGSIWFVSGTGKLFKFTRGNQETLTISGIMPSLSRFDAIYTNEELENLYVLDKEKGRVVVLDKSGGYKAQYLSDEIKKAKGLVVSEKEDKMILLTDTKLHNVDLEHLEK